MIRLSIVAAALAATALPSAALADVLIDNVDGVRIDENGDLDRFTGLWIDDEGKIAGVLDRRDDRPKTDYRLDGEGRVVMPGLIDAHLHVMGVGFGELTLDLSDTRSLAEAQAKIAAFAEENPGRPWIIGRGWNQETWGLGRFPTAAELDAVVADRPVWLERVDGHAGWANTAALRAASVTAATKDVPGGKIDPPALRRTRRCLRRRSGRAYCKGRTYTAPERPRCGTCEGPGKAPVIRYHCRRRHGNDHARLAGNAPRR